jgi:hypothetical protein
MVSRSILGDGEAHETWGDDRKKKADRARKKLKIDGKR